MLELKVKRLALGLGLIVELPRTRLVVAFPRIWTPPHSPYYPCKATDDGGTDRTASIIHNMFVPSSTCYTSPNEEESDEEKKEAAHQALESFELDGLFAQSFGLVQAVC